MGQGAGNLQTLSKTKNGGGGGGVTAADNGLSLNGTIVELGQVQGVGNAGKLIHDTEIPLDNNILSLGGINEATVLLLFPTIQKSILGDAFGNANAFHLAIDVGNYKATIDDVTSFYLITDILNSYYGFGDLSGKNNGSHLNIDDQNQLINFEVLSNPYFYLDVPNGTFNFGDMLTVTNGTYTQVDNLNGRFIANYNLQPYLELNMAAGNYEIGDIGGSLNKSFFTIEDNVQQFIMQSNAGNDRYFLADIQGNLYAFGDIDNSNNGMSLEIDDANMVARITQSLVNDFLRLDTNLNLYEIGDINGIGNNSFLTVDDNTRGLIFKSAAAGHEYLRLQGNIGLYKMGDLSLSANASQIIVDDASQQLSYFTLLGNMLEINAASLEWEIGEKINGIHFQTDIAGKLLKLKNGTNDVKIQMNGVTGFTGTVSPVTSITVNGGIVTNVS